MKKIVLGGSMQFRDVVKQTMQNLQKLGFEALFPNIDFSEKNKDIAFTMELKLRLAKDHYKAMQSADAVYFILPNGYMGTSCKIELGYAIALKKPIYFSELTNDIGLDCYPEKIISLENLEDFKKILS